MKCVNCGAELGLLTKKCPYCGSDNRESAGHQAKMKRYQKRSKTASGTVTKSVQSNVPIVVSAVLLVLLIIAITEAADIRKNVSVYPYKARYQDSLDHEEDYTATMRQYIENKDYAGLEEFCDQHAIIAHKTYYLEFEGILEQTTEYDFIMDALENWVLLSPDAKVYNLDSYVDSIQQHLSYFFKQYEWQKIEEGDDPYREAMMDMKAQVETAAELFLGLDAEKLKAYLAGTENEQLAYLEEVLLDE